MNNLSKTDEDKLIAQAAEGNEKATAILYHHYEGLLIKESRERYLSRTTPPDQTATEEQNFWDVYEDSASLLHITHQSITKAKKRLLTHLRQTISQPTPCLTCVYIL